MLRGTLILLPSVVLACLIAVVLIRVRGHRFTATLRVTLPAWLCYIVGRVLKHRLMRGCSSLWRLGSATLMITVLSTRPGNDALPRYVPYVLVPVRVAGTVVW